MDTVKLSLKGGFTKWNSALLSISTNSFDMVICSSTFAFTSPIRNCSTVSGAGSVAAVILPPLVSPSQSVSVLQLEYLVWLASFQQLLYQCVRHFPYT